MTGDVTAVDRVISAILMATGGPSFHPTDRPLSMSTRREDSTAKVILYTGVTGPTARCLVDREADPWGPHLVDLRRWATMEQTYLGRMERRFAI